MAEMILSALDAFSPSFLAQGMWTHPRDRSTEVNTLSYWLDYARLLERGLFDMLFMADTLGVYDVYGGSPDAALRGGVHIPINDPAIIISGMAAVTKHLGFGITGNLTYEPPYLLARRFSTLDHATDGRIAWNIVTGILQSGARGMGQSAMMSHDQRYDMADDYLGLAYKLWEGSWEDDAVRRDTAAKVYADPAKVHEIVHEGDYFNMRGIHLCEPSPQRTPVLFQAGASDKGRGFAATHAECVFVNGTSRPAMAKTVADIRARAAALGRDPATIRILAGVTVIVGRTEAEAHEKRAEYQSHASTEATLAHASGGLGVDLSRYPLDEPLQYQETDSNRTLMEALTRRGDRQYTVRQVAEEMALSGRNLLIVGSAEQVAAELARWMAETGIDGFNLARLLMPESLEDFIDLVIPLLQERGQYKRAYRQGTLRQKLNPGAAPRLPTSHPAARYRWARA